MEYGLLIALIAAVLCVGIGVTIKTALGDTVACIVAEFQGTTATNTTCTVDARQGSGGSGGAGGGGGGGGGLPVSPSPSPTP